jgi:hypothetical protein
MNDVMHNKYTVRTQIQISEEQAKALKVLSNRRGVSVAELIRQALNPLLSGVGISPEEQRKRALAIVGRFHSGQTEISTEHDRFLAEDYGQ